MRYPDNPDVGDIERKHGGLLSSFLKPTETFFIQWPWPRQLEKKSEEFYRQSSPDAAGQVSQVFLRLLLAAVAVVGDLVLPCCRRTPSREIVRLVLKGPTRAQLLALLSEVFNLEVFLLRGLLRKETEQACIAAGTRSSSPSSGIVRQFCGLVLSWAGLRFLYVEIDWRMVGRQSSKRLLLVA